MSMFNPWLLVATVLCVVLLAKSMGDRRARADRTKPPVLEQLPPAPERVYYVVTTAKRAALCVKNPGERLPKVLEVGADCLIVYPTVEDALKAWMRSWKDRSIPVGLTLLSLRFSPHFVATHNVSAWTGGGMWPTMFASGWLKSTYIPLSALKDEVPALSSSTVPEDEFNKVQQEWKVVEPSARTNVNQYIQGMIRQEVQSRKERETPCTECGWLKLDEIGCDCDAAVAATNN